MPLSPKQKYILSEEPVQPSCLLFFNVEKSKAKLHHPVWITQKQNKFQLSVQQGQLLKLRNKAQKRGA